MIINCDLGGRVELALKRHPTNAKKSSNKIIHSQNVFPQNSEDFD
jgi:hypothetical protein